MSSEVQIAVIDQQDTQIVLAVPGVQGATGSNIPTGGTANQVLRKASSTNYDTNWSLVTNAMVDSSAAIAGTKISPNFGSQNVVTTGTSTAASFIPTSSSVPANGVYLPSANNVAISTNGAQRLLIDSSGNINIDSDTLYVDASNNRVGVKTNSPIGDFHVNGTTITFRGGDGTSARTLELGANATGGGTAISNIRLATYGGNYGVLIRGEADYSNNFGSNLQFATSTTGGTVTERARIDSSGRLLVGTSTSRAVSDSSGNGPQGRIQIEAANSDALISIISAGTADAFRAGTLSLGRHRNSTVGGTPTVVQSGDTLGAICFAGGDGTDMLANGASITCQVDGTPGNDDMPGRLVFSTWGSDGTPGVKERMRIGSSGQIDIGNTTNGAYTVTRNTGVTAYFDRRGSDGTTIQFERDGSGVGTISVTTTATAYNTSSDYRLKESVVPLTGAIDRVNQLQVHRFNFIADPDKTVDGFIAHEAQAVVPECVTGTKDEVDAEGNPVYQGIDQSKLVPLLTAALQEALQKIEDLEGRLTAAGL